MIGDTTGNQAYGGRSAYAYEVLCRRHHCRGVTRALAGTTMSDPLPFSAGSADGPGDQFLGNS